MDTQRVIQGHFKYSHFEVTWIHQDLPSGDSEDTITRTYGHGLDYSETVKLDDPATAAERFLHWTMSLSCLTDKQALDYFTSLMRARDLELAALWNEAVAAAQESQSTSRVFLEIKYDPERRLLERTEANKAYVEARKRLVAALVELKVVKRPE